MATSSLFPNLSYADTARVLKNYNDAKKTSYTESNVTFSTVYGSDLTKPSISVDLAIKSGSKTIKAIYTYSRINLLMLTTIKVPYFASNKVSTVQDIVDTLNAAYGSAIQLSDISPSVTIPTITEDTVGPVYIRVLANPYSYNFCGYFDVYIDVVVPDLSTSFSSLKLDGFVF